MFLSFLGRPTLPLFLPFLTYSNVGAALGAGAGAGAGVGTSGFSFTCSPSDSPSEYESAEFPDITGRRVGVFKQQQVNNRMNYTASSSFVY